MTDFELITEKDEYVTFVHGEPVIDLYNLHKLENRILDELAKIQGKIFTAHNNQIMGHYPEDEIISYSDMHFAYRTSIIVPAHAPFMITNFESNSDYDVGDSFQRINQATKIRYEYKVCLIRQMQIRFTFLYKAEVGCSICCPVVFRKDPHVLTVGFAFDRWDENIKPAYHELV